MIRQHSRAGEFQQLMISIIYVIHSLYNIGEIIIGYVPKERNQDPDQDPKTVEIPSDLSQLSSSGILELLPCENASNSETINLAKRIMFLIDEYEKTGDATALVTKMFPLTAEHPRKDSANPFTY